MLHAAIVASHRAPGKRCVAARGDSPHSCCGLAASTWRIIGFVGERRTIPGAKVALLGAGVVALWLASSSRWVDRRLSHLIDRALARYTDLEVRDYASLLHLAGEYHVSELMCQQGDWLEGQSLAELRLRDEGVMVLGITRDDGTYLGAPDGNSVVRAGDTLLLYGRATALESLDARQHGRSGDREHQSAVAEHERCIADERARDPADEHPTGHRGSSARLPMV